MAVVFPYFAKQERTNKKEQGKSDVEGSVAVPYRQKCVPHVLYCLWDALFNEHIGKAIHDPTPFLTMPGIGWRACLPGKGILLLRITQPESKKRDFMIF